MILPPTRFIVGLGVFLVATCLGPLPVDAQDRSVPRFGPLVAPDTVEAGTYHLGRTWSLARPPMDYVETEYGISANERGLRNARRATVRLPGCSGALVSPEGLVLTAARCIRSSLSAAGDVLRDSALYAETRESEILLPGIHVDQLTDVQDVTARVESAMEPAASSDSMAAEWEQAVAEVERELQTEGEADTIDVVRERGGEQYVAYTYRRFRDVRLVFLPHSGVRWGQRLEDQLTYPQYAWDVAVLRIYTDGTPAQTDTHFELRSQGVRPGDAVFAMGYPKSTRRADTHHQFELRRDLEHPVAVSELEDWTGHLQRYVDTAETVDSHWTNRLQSAGERLKRMHAQLESLQNSYVMRRLQRRDDELRQPTESDSVRAARAGELIDELAEIQARKRERAESYRAFSHWLHPTYSSATLRRAQIVQRQAEEGGSLGRDALQSVADQPGAVDAALLAETLDRFRRHLGTDTSLVDTLNRLGSAQDVIRSSALSSKDAIERVLEDGSIPADDPAVELVNVVWSEYTDFRDAWTTLRARERRLTDSLLTVRYQRADEPVALPQSRAYRMADGRVEGYPYNGTIAPPFTTFYGLYGHHQSLETEANVTLPSVWRSPGDVFDRSTPLTVVSSTDFGEGGYGGPLVNSSLQLVGIVADGNVQRAAADVLYLPARMRTVSMDIRGIVEGLSSIYDAEPLVQEMRGQPLSSQ